MTRKVRLIENKEMGLRDVAQLHFFVLSFPFRYIRITTRDYLKVIGTIHSLSSTFETAFGGLFKMI